MKYPSPGKSDRRGFLGVAAGAVVGGGLASIGCDRVVDPIANPADDVDTTGWIDAHVHIWTPDLEKYPLGRGFGIERLKPPSFTVEELLAECRPHGVTRVVLVQNTFDRDDHSYLLDAMRAFSGTFGGVALVDPERSRDPVGEMKSLAGRGIRGFRLRARAETAGEWIDAPVVRQMWQAAAEAGHWICCLADEQALPAIRRMCEAFPETPVVIDHFGRIGVTGIIEEASLKELLAMADLETVHVKTSAFYALGKKAAPYTDLGPMIRQLRDAYGAERLMWASDCPYQVQKGHNYGDSIALIRDRLDFLTESDKNWMLRGTAEKVFFGS